MLDLIMGLVDPVAGSMTADGRTIRSPNNEWTQNFAFVPQVGYLLKGSVADNVRFGGQS